MIRHSEAGFWQRLVEFGQAVLPAVMLGSALLALGDVVLARIGAPQSGSALGLLWACGLAICCAVGVGTFATIALALSSGVARPRRWVSLGVGADGHSLVGVVVWWVVLGATWIPLSWGAELLPLTTVGSEVARIAARLAAVLLAWAAYRLSAARGRCSHAPQWLLVGSTLLVAYYLTATQGQRLAPHSLPIAVVGLQSLAGLTVATLLSRLKPSGVVLGVVVGALGVVGAVTIITYEVDGLEHALLAGDTTLGYPTRSLLLAVADLDGDGAASILGGADCEPWDGAVGPGQMEIAGDGIDQNCRGGDAPERAQPSGSRGELSSSLRSQPPVIFITVDTLRADVVTPSVTPMMSALAAQGWDFRYAYAPSTHTEESIPAVMSGRFPRDWQRGSTFFGMDETVPEVLGRIGYQTVGVTAFPRLVRALGHGLETLDNSVGLAAAQNPTKLLAEQTTTTALRHVDERDTSRPLFLWVHYFDPHAPLIADGPGEGSYMRDVALTDRAVARLLDGLSERGLLEPAIVVLFSDHGESLGEHGIMTHVWGAYESIVRVPLIIRVPGVAPRAVSLPVSLVSVFPTLIELLQIDGVPVRAAPSLLETVRRDEASPIFVDADSDGRHLLSAVRLGPWKLIEDRRRHTLQLFQLASDPGETVNLIEHAPAKLREMRALLAEHEDSFDDVHTNAKMARFRETGPWTPSTLIVE